MKDVIVNGETHEGISTVELALAAGGTTLFRDIDEMSGGVDGIVEIACGRFTVTAEAANAPAIAHGMSVKPDAAVCIPVPWHDTTNYNLAVAAVSQYAAASYGRRELAETSTGFGAGNMAETYITDTTIQFLGGAYAKFQPTWTDAEGNTGTQVYLWVAVKFAE